MLSNRLDGLMRQYEMTRTIPSDKNEMINSQYGRISMLNWCKAEVLRIVADGGYAELWEQGRMVAVK